MPCAAFQLTAARRRLVWPTSPVSDGYKFQLTAARRRLALHHVYSSSFERVSTHSRPKAAGGDYNANGIRTWSFNSQPPEGGWLKMAIQDLWQSGVSTHSRPKAAGAAAETLNPQGLHRPVSLRFHRRHMTLLYHSQVRPIFPNC